jgi:hypothetical protein
MLEILAAELDPSKPDHVCALAAACVAFWSQSRLGELLSPRANSYDPRRTFRRIYLGRTISSQGSCTLDYPWTKTKGFAGDKSVLSRQQGISDPIAALEAHLRLNDIPEHLPLFSFAVPTGLQYLTKKRLLLICNTVWISHGIPKVTGHSF